MAGEGMLPQFGIPRQFHNFIGKEDPLNTERDKYIYVKKQLIRQLTNLSIVLDSLKSLVKDLIPARNQFPDQGEVDAKCTSTQQRPVNQIDNLRYEIRAFTLSVQI